jgi:hypothetical protein
LELNSIFKEKGERTRNKEKEGETERWRDRQTGRIKSIHKNKRNTKLKKK